MVVNDTDRTEFQRTIELRIPCELRYEKVAINSAATVARQLGFEQDRIEDVKTAVGEVCINAIEHGGNLREARDIRVRFILEPAELRIDVCDGGTGFDLAEVDVPRIDDKVGGGNPRGWGLFIIRALVDDLQVRESGRHGNEVSLFMRNRTATAGTDETEPVPAVRA